MDTGSIMAELGLCNAYISTRLSTSHHLTLRIAVAIFRRPGRDTGSGHGSLLAA